MRLGQECTVCRQTHSLPRFLFDLPFPYCLFFVWFELYPSPAACSSFGSRLLPLVFFDSWRGTTSALSPLSIHATLGRSHRTWFPLPRRQTECREEVSENTVRVITAVYEVSLGKRVHQALRKTLLGVFYQHSSRKKTSEKTNPPLERKESIG